MTTTLRLIIRVSFIALILLILHSPAEIILEDDFNYTGWDIGSKPMNSVWKSVQSVPRYLIKGDISDKPYACITNGVIVVQLDKTVTEDFSLTIRLISSDYTQFHWFGITDNESMQGYYVGWDTAIATQCGSAGWVAIGKIDRSNAKRLAFFKPGALLTEGKPSGHSRTNKQTAAISAPFAEFTLHWKQKEGTLVLEIDNVERLRVTDTAFNHFSRLYIAGSNSLFVESVKLTTP